MAPCGRSAASTDLPTQPGFGAEPVPNLDALAAVRAKARRSLREAEAMLDVLEPMVHAGSSSAVAAPVPSRALMAAGTFSSLTDVPQYDRTHVQGCVCKPAIAGGACCPSNLGSLALQPMAPGHVASHGAGHGPHGALGAVSGLLGVFGLYSGYQVLKGAEDAALHLDRVGLAAEQRESELATLRERLGGWPALEANRAHVARSHAAMASMRRDVTAAQEEQTFYRWVPGRLQMVASLGVLGSAVHHLAQGALGAAAGVLLGVATHGLFAIYGAAMAIKNGLTLWRDRGLSPHEDVSGLPEGYRRDYAAHVRARRLQSRDTALAWTGVSLAAGLGAAVTLGAVALPYGLPITAGLTFVAGALAMWNNSCSRYAPHLPVSPHVQREAMATAGERADLYLRLQVQQEAILEANARMRSAQGALTALREAYERALAPQCGADAFMVLPRAVGRRVTNGPAGSPDDAQAQRAAVQRYLVAEFEIVLKRSMRALERLQGRYWELRSLVDDGEAESPGARAQGGRASVGACCGTAQAAPAKAFCCGDDAPVDSAPSCCGGDEAPAPASDCCSAKAPPAAPAFTMQAPHADRLYATLAARLEADLAKLTQDSETLGVLQQLLGACETLADVSEPIAIRDPKGALSEAQKLWLFLRLNVLQQGGLLRDSLSRTFVNQHGEALKARHTVDMWPLGNVYPLPEKLDALAQAMVPSIEVLFVHAFFNPRRIEAEMDYLFEMEVAQARSGGDETPDEAAFVAPAASGATCCSR